MSDPGLVYIAPKARSYVGTRERDLLELVCLRLLGAHEHDPDSASDSKRLLRTRHDELLSIYTNTLAYDRQKAREQVRP